MLSHISDENRPTMVDVSRKRPSRRTARARAIVVVPREVCELFAEGEIRGPKGPVFDTAAVAGTMGAKRTGELIPFCHPIRLEDCRLEISLQGDRVVIDCFVVAEGKTGVEMEALTAAATAALTVYDMCKAVSKEIVISDVRLLEKSGGRSGHYRREG